MEFRAVPFQAIGEGTQLLCNKNSVSFVKPMEVVGYAMIKLRNISICVKTVLKICVCLLIMVPCAAFSASTSFAPPVGKTLLLVGQDRDTIAHYVSKTGNVPGGTMVYTSIQTMDGLEAAVDYGGGPMDGDVLLKSYPNSVIQLGLYMVDGLNNTIVGTYDANLKTLAQWIKKANRPVYLRIGYEFDNPSNHYDPQQYKQAFRYVVDFLRKEGVRNAAYVWHSEDTAHPWMDWYPGDDYVDWFGKTIFRTKDIPVASNFLKLAREHGKPFMICESSPWGMYTSRWKIDWLDHMFQFIKDQNVEAFCYIDCDWDKQQMWVGQNWGDARLEENVDTKNLWLREIDQDRYLKASPDLFRLLGWIKLKP